MLAIDAVAAAVAGLPLYEKPAERADVRRWIADAAAAVERLGPEVVVGMGSGSALDPGQGRAAGHGPRPATAAVVQQARPRSSGSRPSTWSPSRPPAVYGIARYRAEQIIMESVEDTKDGASPSADAAQHRAGRPAADHRHPHRIRPPTPASTRWPRRSAASCTGRTSSVLRRAIGLEACRQHGGQGSSRAMRRRRATSRRGRKTSRCGSLMAGLADEPVRLLCRPRAPRPLDAGSSLGLPHSADGRGRLLSETLKVENQPASPPGWSASPTPSPSRLTAPATGGPGGPAPVRRCWPPVACRPCTARASSTGPTEPARRASRWPTTA